MMRSIADRIATRTPIPNNSAEVGFVNQTSEPVYKMLSVGTSIPGSGLADSLIGQYRDVIAADYAYVMLERNLRVGMAAPGQGLHTFGIMKQDRRYKRIARRGMKRVLLEIFLVSIGHNLYKYYNKHMRMTKAV
jgi:hypothetical protein